LIFKTDETAFLHDINAVAFSPNSKYVATGGFWGIDEDICLWNMADRRLEQRFGRKKATCGVLEFSPDGLLLATAGTFSLHHFDLELTDGVHSDIFSLLDQPHDREVVVWETISGKARSTFVHHKGGVVAIAFMSDGVLASGSVDGDLCVFYIDDGGVACTIPSESPITALAVSNDRTFLAASYMNGSTRMWQSVDLITR
jgi:WD40 repeat protein